MHGEGVGGAVGLVVPVEVLLQPGEDVLLGEVGEHALVQVGAVSAQVTLADKHGSTLMLQTIHWTFASAFQFHVYSTMFRRLFFKVS